MRARSLSLVFALLAACTPAAEPPNPPVVAAEPVPTAGPHIRFDRAGEGELATLVRAHVASARAEGRVPLVYVGATWCEPCQYFHAAAERGDLDDELPALAILELDLDVDSARIEAAGYRSQMIPLFAVPGEDGRASDRRIEGSIHGPGSPMQIAPRLRAIIAPSAR